MNKSVKRKIRVNLYLIFFIMLVMVTLSLFMIFRRDNYNYVNICRVILSDEMYNVENKYNSGNMDKLQNEKYKFSIIDFAGNVIKSTEDNLKYSDTVDIRTDMTFDSYYEVKNENKVIYSTFILNNGRAEAVVRYIVPINEVKKLCNSPLRKYITLILIILAVVIVLILLKTYKIIKIDVFNPINEMHSSARSILRGNLDEKVLYDYDGEIGEFSHDFEKMRDNLKDSRDSEAKLKRNEKELLACISHDLKTPISSISGYCEGILDGIVKSEEDVKRYSSIILKKARVLTKLIDDMLEYSKAEINEMTIRKEDVYSADYFFDILEDLSLDVETKNRRFILNGEIPNVLLNIDKNRIQEVMYNLVSNSIKYTNESGVIEVSIEKKNGSLIVHVKDDGMGIAADDIPNVFKKFYRGEKYRNMNIPGSGLGLSISKYIVEKHGGYIEINSSLKQGTEVIFSIKYN